MQKQLTLKKKELTGSAIEASSKIRETELKTRKATSSKSQLKAKRGLKKKINKVRDLIEDMKKEIVSQNGYRFKIHDIYKFYEHLEQSTNKHIVNFRKELELAENSIL